MTYIEFFDRSHSENLCACLTKMPDRVVLIGKDRKVMENSIKNYSAVLDKRGMGTEFVIKAVSMNNLKAILNCFEGLVNKYDGCMFDLSGGDELYLVAAGMTYSKYPEKGIELVRFNINANKIYDCDGNGLPEFPGFPRISVEENVVLYGGDVMYGDGATYKWNMTDELFADIGDIWDICRADPRRWNSFINVLAAADRISAGNIAPNVNVGLLSSHTEKLVTKSNFDFETMSKLEEKGLVENCSFSGSKLILKYKNEQIKRCLTKAGQALEMAVYTAVLKARDGTEPVYNDVLTGVCIDWNGAKPGAETENEIDVMMMHGLIPVFVSCKNGFVETDELYKLNTVSHRFGGRYAKKVLVASSLDKNTTFGRGLTDRAEAMGIRVIHGEVSDWDMETLTDKVKNLWK